jgi:hypothetical protein
MSVPKKAKKRQLASDSKALAASRSNGQSGKRKQFSQAQYDRHDAVAVAAVLRHLDAVEGPEWGRVNDDVYGPDVVVWRGFRPVRYIEVEQRSAWSGGPFPPAWTPVNIPERKLHLFNLGLRCDIWIISMDLKFALIIPDTVISEFGVLEEFNNSEIRVGEKFMRVPLSECIQLSLESDHCQMELEP